MNYAELFEKLSDDLAQPPGPWEKYDFMNPHQIIIPQGEEYVSQEVLQRRKRYETDKDFKFTADHIHETRMLSIPCCDDCMRLAELQMKKKAELWEE